MPLGSALLAPVPFFLIDAAPTEIYTLSLHDALPIFRAEDAPVRSVLAFPPRPPVAPIALERSEEHTSELQSHSDLVCRLLLEKKTAFDLVAQLGLQIDYLASLPDVKRDKIFLVGSTL